MMICLDEDNDALVWFFFSIVKTRETYINKKETGDRNFITCERGVDEMR